MAFMVSLSSDESFAINVKLLEERMVIKIHHQTTRSWNDMNTGSGVFVNCIYVEQMCSAYCFRLTLLYA